MCHDLTPNRAWSSMGQHFLSAFSQFSINFGLREGSCMRGAGICQNNTNLEVKRTILSMFVGPQHPITMFVHGLTRSTTLYFIARSAKTRERDSASRLDEHEKTTNDFVPRPSNRCFLEAPGYSKPQESSCWRVLVQSSLSATNE